MLHQGRRGRTERVVGQWGKEGGCIGSIALLKKMFAPKKGVDTSLPERRSWKCNTFLPSSIPFPLCRDPTSVPALDIVINNLESEDGGGGGILSNLSGASSPAYTHEQMMAAIRELQNDVNLLCNDPNNGTFRPDDGRYQ